jgi:hypothetical protein
MVTHLFRSEEFARLPLLRTLVVVHQSEDSDKGHWQGQLLTEGKDREFGVPISLFF